MGYRGGIFFNEDDTHFFMTRADKSITEESIRDFIRQYAGSQISDFVLCCAGRIVGFPSKVRDSWIDKCYQMTENGMEVSYKDHPCVRTARRMFEELKLDFYEICLDELRRQGMRSWLSIRMNDCHCNSDSTSFLHPDFYHERPDLRRVQHREPIGYFDRCYDFGQPEIRQMMLEFIEETVNRYDADGLELDWQREIFCFRIGHEWEGIQILTDFMRQVRAILDRAGEKWGHRIRICSRTLATPQFSLDCGLDVIGWAREGLTDVIVPTARWETVDSDIPVELWRQLLHGMQTELAAGIEFLQRANNRAPFLPTSKAGVNGLAAQYLSMGADKVYLYNYMDMYVKHMDEAEYMNMLSTVGSMDTLMKTERRHVVTYTDVGPVWFQAGRQAPLPVELPREEPRFIRVRVGRIAPGAKVEIRLGIANASGESVRVYANSGTCRYLRTEQVVPAYTENPAAVYEMENDGKIPPFVVIEMIAEKEGALIDYAEVHVQPEQ